MTTATITADRLGAEVPTATGRARWRALLRGRPTDAPWVRPSVLALLVATAVLYLWGLGASGWANSFYTAAVQAGAHSWKALFFGSFDSSNFITVDKPPVALWVMDLSARAFGVNAWSVLAPQALEGVAAVGLLYLTVRRRFSPAAGLLAGGVLALTPVATLMFRFNNPDALLVLLLVAAAYACTRAVESASSRWLVLCAALVGTGFLTKMLQAYLVVPVFTAVYLLAAPTTVRRRVAQTLLAGAALLVSSGWWVAVVELTPASARPYVGGSQTNSVLDLVFGYNGFGRLSGNETGSVGGGPVGAASRWGPTGLTRMFGTEFGGQISWLIPAALLLAATLLWMSRHRARTDVRRAQVLLWAGWLVVTGLVFSEAKGIIHPYYSVALAPAVAALVGIGAAGLWPHRRRLLARGALAVALVVTAWWSDRLLDRSPDWHPWLRTTVLAAGLLASVAILAAPWLRRPAARVLAATAVVVALAGPAAYSLQTAATPEAGAIPSAGPAVVAARGGLARRPPGGLAGARTGAAPFAGAPLAGAPFPRAPFAGMFAGRPAGGRGGGGFLDARHPASSVVAALRAGASSYRWVAAAVGANNAAGYQLAADEPAMAIGGFNGSDPTPTLEQFQAFVRAGAVHYFVAGGGPGAGPGRSGAAEAITTWVQKGFTAVTVGGTTLYDLTAPVGG